MNKQAVELVQQDLATIRERIKSARKKAGMNQHDMADALGMAYRTYSEKERGANHKDFYLHELLKLADILKLRPSALIAGESANKVVHSIHEIVNAHAVIGGALQKLTEKARFYDNK